MKSEVKVWKESVSGPSPHGEGGLKYTFQMKRRRASVSLPTRGGWIEMTDIKTSKTPTGCPSPHGEGGLKLGGIIKAGAVILSLPTRGGWIEMDHLPGPGSICPGVPPHTGRVD